MSLIGNNPDEEITLNLRDVEKGEETPFKGTPRAILHIFKRTVAVVFNGAMMRQTPPPEDILQMRNALGL